MLHNLRNVKWKNDIVRSARMVFGYLRFVSVHTEMPEKDIEAGNDPQDVVTFYADG